MKHCPIVLADNFRDSLLMWYRFGSSELISYPWRFSNAFDGYIGLKTPEDLRKIQENPAGKFMLLSSISLENCEFLHDIEFSGVLDGCGRELSDLNQSIQPTGNAPYGGLFRSLRDAEIRNLKISGSIYIDTSNCSDFELFEMMLKKGSFGGLAGSASGSNRIINCLSNVEIHHHVDFEFMRPRHYYYGGIIGRLYADGQTEIRNCLNQGKIQEADRCGGIVGCISVSAKAVSPTVIISCCRNTGAISWFSSPEEAEDKRGFAGGIVGQIAGSLEEVNGEIHIDQCNNQGIIMVPSQACGILGEVCEPDPKRIFISNCLNEGHMRSSKTAGITPDAYAHVSVCINTGDLERRNSSTSLLAGFSPNRDLTVEYRNFSLLSLDSNRIWYRDSQGFGLQVFNHKHDPAYHLLVLKSLFVEESTYILGNLGKDSYDDIHRRYSLSFDYTCDDCQSCSGACRTFVNYAAHEICSRDLSTWFSVEGIDNADSLRREINTGDVLCMGDNRYAIVQYVMAHGILLAQSKGDLNNGRCNILQLHLNWEQLWNQYCQNEDFQILRH